MRFWWQEPRARESDLCVMGNLMGATRVAKGQVKNLTVASSGER